VTKITNFGVFVELESSLEGLLHVSELSTNKIQSPEDVVKLGDQVEVTVLRVDPDECKIGLSMIASDDGSGPKILHRAEEAASPKEVTEEEPKAEPAPAPEKAEVPEEVAEEEPKAEPAPAPEKAEVPEGAKGSSETPAEKVEPAPEPDPEPEKPKSDA